VSSFDGGTETDPFHNTTFAGRLGYAFTPDVSLDVRAYFADGKANYDGFPPPFYSFADEGDFAKTRQWVVYGGLNFALFDGRLQNRVAWQTTDTDRDAFLADTAGVTKTSAFDGKNRRFEYQGTWKIADGYQAVFGLQHEHSEFTSDDPSSAEVDQKSAYVQLQAEVIKGLTLTAGDRYDDHDTFGSHNTAQLAAAWSLDSGTILRASWGEGFKAPTLYQLFSPYANPDLKPESSKGWDAGVEQHFMDSKAMLSATYFSRKTDNQIDFSDCPFTGPSVCTLPGHSPFGYYSNTARTKAQGVELQGSIAVTPELLVNANYTKMKATDESPGSVTFGERLIRRPDTLANASISYTWPVRLVTTVAARYSGASFDNDFNVFPAARVTLHSYTLVDFRASYSLNDRFEIAGRIENAFDRHYETVLQYGTVGRAGYVSVNFKL
jgi:vitamin B12 transporter